MCAEGSKDFGPIREDYTFFEDHATEAAEDLRAYLPHLAPLRKRDEISMLDFGCGEGRFTERFLADAGFAADRLQLRLVEPDPVYRQEAAARLCEYSTRPIVVDERLPDGLQASVDFILSNHVLYYVADLHHEVDRLIGALRLEGLLLTAMGGRENIWIDFWLRGFALINQPIPFYTGEDLQTVLAERQLSTETEDVEYELSFADTTDNRLKILRFLFGKYLSELPQQKLLAFFEPYSDNGKVFIPTRHKHFVVRCDRSSTA